MAIKFQKQNDFSGGEVSFSMMMRDDLELYGKSCLSMINFYPTLQGTVVRNPGTRFMYSVLEEDDVTPPPTMRIFPYVTPQNDFALIEMLPQVGAVLGNLTILNGIGDAVGTETNVNPKVSENGNVRVVNNGKLNGFAGWEVNPNQWVSSEGSTYGWRANGSGFQVTGLLRDDGRDTQGIVNTMVGSFVVPQDTATVQTLPAIEYVTNFTDSIIEGGATAFIYIGTEPTGVNRDDIETIDLSFMDPGQRYTTARTISAVGKLLDDIFAEGTTYYITFEFTAVEVAGHNENHKLSAPYFVLKDMDILAPKLIDSDVGKLTAVIPYTESEIKDVHFVQSPYTGADVGGIGKEMVFTHPNHPPKRLYFDGAVYLFEDIFTDDNTQFYEQWNWATLDPTPIILNGYPATCTAYLGRLVFAGSTTSPIANSGSGTNTETVWTTIVGDWGKFTDPNKTPVLPEDTVSFTATYRSPIKWVFGQKELLIGAESLEYVATADAIFQPADIGVTMQSTHGSNAVQPVGMGQYVLFSAENGTKVRAMSFDAEDESWVSPDLTLAHPELFQSGIRRMVRMRNPHQLAVFVMSDGNIAILSQDPHANISAWSRIDMGGEVIDACVLPDRNGTDVLYVAVKRTKGDGTVYTYIEAIIDWTQRDSRHYVNSYVAQLGDGVTNVISGLDHLEGQNVQVMADNKYLGTYIVGDGVAPGTIELIDQLGIDILYTRAVVGLTIQSTLITMPLVTQDPKSKKRYTSIIVRTLRSIRPIINGQRVKDRDPLNPFSESQRPDIFYDNEVANMGSDSTQLIEITENLPFRVEVIGIFGKVSETRV